MERGPVLCLVSVPTMPSLLLSVLLWVPSGAPKLSFCSRSTPSLLSDLPSKRAELLQLSDFEASHDLTAPIGDTLNPEKGLIGYFQRWVNNENERRAMEAVMGHPKPPLDVSVYSKSPAIPGLIAKLREFDAAHLAQSKPATAGDILRLEKDLRVLLKEDDHAYKMEHFLLKHSMTVSLLNGFIVHFMRFVAESPITHDEQAARESLRVWSELPAILEAQKQEAGEKKGGLLAFKVEQPSPMNPNSYKEAPTQIDLLLDRALQRTLSLVSQLHPGDWKKSSLLTNTVGLEKHSLQEALEPFELALKAIAADVHHDSEVAAVALGAYGILRVLGGDRDWLTPEKAHHLALIFQRLAFDLGGARSSWGGAENYDLLHWAFQMYADRCHRNIEYAWATLFIAVAAQTGIVEVWDLPQPTAPPPPPEPKRQSSRSRRRSQSRDRDREPTPPPPPAPGLYGLIKKHSISPNNVKTKSVLVPRILQHLADQGLLEGIKQKAGKLMAGWKEFTEYAHDKRLMYAKYGWASFNTENEAAAENSIKALLGVVFNEHKASDIPDEGRPPALDRWTTLDLDSESVAQRALLSSKPSAATRPHSRGPLRKK